MNAIALTIALALAFAPRAATAQPTVDSGAFTGSDLYKLCMSGEKTSQGDAFCNGFIWGMQQGMWVAQEAREVSAGSCLPHDPDGVQSRLIVEKYMRDRPEKLNEGAGAVIATALYQAFPCKRAGR